MKVNAMSFAKMIAHIQQTGSGCDVDGLPIGVLESTHRLPWHTGLTGKIEGIEQLLVLCDVVYLHKEVGLLWPRMPRILQHRRDGKTHVRLAVCRVHVTQGHHGSLIDGRRPVLGTQIVDASALSPV